MDSEHFIAKNGFDYTIIKYEDFFDIIIGLTNTDKSRIISDIDYSDYEEVINYIINI